MSFPFSDRTIAYLAEAMCASNSHSTLGNLITKAGGDPWAVRNWNNKLDRAQGVLTNLRDDGSPTAETAAFELARLTLFSGKRQSTWSDDPQEWWVGLKDVIAADGWEFDPATDDFVPLVPGASVPAEMAWLEGELTRRGWTVAAGHYRQAVENFADGNWASANGQLRACFESVTRTAGNTINSANSNGQVQQAFSNMDNAGQLLVGEADFGKALWKLLHPGGAHPGLSDEDESRFRLLTLTGYIRFLLVRLPD